jgi:predicted acyltransferase
MVMTDSALPTGGGGADAGTDARATAATRRLQSLDAFRGLIMLMMGSAGLAFGEVTRRVPGRAWHILALQTDHTRWVGCSVWDFIQPCFMFMVGVAVPYSYARREALGHTRARILAHAVQRATILVFLSLFCVSFFDNTLTLTFLFTNVLAQIGLGYVFVVLLCNHGIRPQSAAVVAILASYWGLFWLYPATLPEAFDRAACGVGPDWPLLSGLAAHWNIHTNFAAWFDRWFLNLFPRATPFLFEPEGYQTLNFVPSVATMILGLMAGELLRSPRPPGRKLAILACAGTGLIAVGLGAGLTVCPIIKKIWTPSWTLVSGGAAVWLLAAFYGVIDAAGWRRWTFPLVVVGTNSIAAYLLVDALWMPHWGPADRALYFLGRWEEFNPVLLPLVPLAGLAALWLICRWMYRRKIFLRI